MRVRVQGIGIRFVGHPGTIVRAGASLERSGRRRRRRATVTWTGTTTDGRGGGSSLLLLLLQFVLVVLLFMVPTIARTGPTRIRVGRVTAVATHLTLPYLTLPFLW
jgi:hypothetical protein